MVRRRISKPVRPTPALRRLGMATPPPFVGRKAELEALAVALRDAALVVIHGAVGAGKTRLARELAARIPSAAGAGEPTALQPAFVRCLPGDRAEALRARAERALGVLPGSLEEVLRDEARLLFIDDAHNLPEADAARLFAELVREPGAGRLVLLTRDVLPLRRQGARRMEMNLEGLDESSARELWHHLEETYGPTPTSACDEALTLTRGMPLALRREYARAAAGKDAWSLEALPAEVRRALEAVAVVRLPVAPAAVGAIAPKVDVEPALIDLVSRQLIDPLEDGRFEIHDIVREEVLEALDAKSRLAMERAAAELVTTAGRGRRQRRRVAWDAGDDGALGLVDPIDRLREAVHHLLAAGEVDAAVCHLADDREAVVRRGGGGEMLALLEQLERLDPSAPEELRRVRAGIAARRGRIAEALEHGGPGDAIETAVLTFLAGDATGACEALSEISGSEDADVRGRAAAALSEVELDVGEPERAASRAAEAFEDGRARLSDDARARLHLAMAIAEERAGRFTSARAALSRAASSGRLDEMLAARIEVRRAICLAREGRLSEARKVLDAAEEVAREVDAVAVADELRGCRALVRALAGDAERAARDLHALIERRRERGDEVGALRAEIDLATISERRGELAAAAELATACAGSATRRGLRGLAVRASLVSASIDVAELRLEDAGRRLQALEADPAADRLTRLSGVALLSQVKALSGASVPLAKEHDAEDLDGGRARAFVALAGGDCLAALEQFRDLAVRAERAGRVGDMAEALAVLARLTLARGDKPAARAAATRAARKALECGLTGARAGALLVLAALARDEGEVKLASTYAQDASSLASEAGLPVERLVAAQAMEVIAAGEQGAGAAGEVHAATAATMTAAAREAAERMLADLGLTAARPFRVIGAGGEESFVADAGPELLRMSERELAVDGVREIIVRDGKQVADLRRRSLLKRLLFLFAASPGKNFSKEQIVETVWSVEYHPLRHDAALFTNIMRIRRLLGKDGADLIRVGEDGYRFCPPRDFLFVESIEG